jgi:hypothetical protein
MDWTGFSQQDSTATQHLLSHFGCAAWLHGCLFFVVLALICCRCLRCLVACCLLLGCLLFVAWLPVVCVSWLPVVYFAWLPVLVVLALIACCLCRLVAVVCRACCLLLYVVCFAWRCVAACLGSVAWFLAAWLFLAWSRNNGG